MPTMGTGLDGVRVAWPTANPIATAKMRCAPIEPLSERILKPESYQAQIWHLAHATC